MQEQDYKTIAYSRLTDRHRNDGAFLAILDTLIELKEIRQREYLKIADEFLDIDKSTGKNLDLIGKLIGEERTLVNFIDRSYFGFLGARLAEPYDIGYWYSLYKNKYGTLRTLTDEEYRRVLKARIIKNSSDNNRNSFIEVLNILSGNTNSSVIESYNNTAITVNVEDVDGLVSYYLSKYKSDRNLIPVPLGRRLNINHVTSPIVPDPEIPSNEMHFATLAGSVDYVGTQGDQILLSDGTIIDVTSTDETFTFDVPLGKHKVKLVESVDRNNFVSVGGEALVELINFPSLSTITKFNFSTHDYNDTPNLTKVPEHFPSNIINIEDLFNTSVNFNQDISMWNVSNVKIFDFVFSMRDIAFNQPLNSWDVSSATSMWSLFEGATNFNHPLDNWNVSNVNDMSNMFYGATSFNQDISMWDVSNVNTMQSMFRGATVFDQDLSSWNVSNVTSMSRMFEDATSFNQDISMWETSNVTNMYFMFGGAQAFNSDLSGWDTSKVTDTSRMFSGSTSFNQDISGWDTSNVTNMLSMFQNATSFNQDISLWNVAKVNDMSRMFRGATNFNQDLSQWCVGLITSLPVEFDLGATNWTLPRPVWGTCPV